MKCVNCNSEFELKSKGFKRISLVSEKRSTEDIESILDVNDVTPRTGRSDGRFICTHSEKLLKAASTGHAAKQKLFSKTCDSSYIARKRKTSSVESAMPKKPRFELQTTPTDLMDKLYDGKSAMDKGTLFHLKNIFNQRSVSKHVSESFNYVSDFLKFVTAGYVLLFAMDILQMEDIEEQVDIEDKEDVLNSVSETIVDRVWRKVDLITDEPQSYCQQDSREQKGPLDETLKSTLRSDTMFGDEASRESVTEQSQRSTLREETRPETEAESETPPVDSDSEGLVMAPRPSKRKQKPESKHGNSVTIAINHVSLEENADVMNNTDIGQLFVEYKFLGIDPQETETPFSLPKPKPYHNRQFNFSKNFHVDFENHYQRRQYLASMLLPSDPDDGRIRFTLVSEPPEDEPEGECEEVGVALVSIRDILRHRKDVVEEDIDILDISDEKTVIGGMNLTVQCLAALDSVQKEMKIEEEISEDISPEQSQRSTLQKETRPETEEESETPPVESESGGLVMAPRPSKRKQKPESKPGNSVTIAINHVSLKKSADVMNNTDIGQLFVEYKFLGIDPEETATPFSLPKPKPYHNIQFNFSKNFHVDFENHYQRRQYLASMLLPSNPGRIRFTLVSEPPEDEPEGECEEVGVALVSIRDILRHRKDVVEEDIDILDISDEKTVIGGMNLTVQCLAALDSVQKEMKIEEEISEDISPEQSQRSTLQKETRPETEEESETPPVESESGGLVMAPRPSKRKQKPESKPGNSVTIAINHVSLKKSADVMNNTDIGQLFVEYKFLSIDPEETATPFSLPKPKPYHNIQFNFSKNFHVDFENHYQRRQYLASMLLPSNPGRIRFTLVSEPPEDEPEGECEEVGVALVSIRDILRHRKDVVEEDIDILDISDEKTVIGGMNLTVQCLAALDSVKKEMKIEGTY